MSVFLNALNKLRIETGKDVSDLGTNNRHLTSGTAYYYQNTKDWFRRILEHVDSR